MVHREIKLKPGSGMQAKTAAEFIQRASDFKSTIWVEKDEKVANAKSLLGLLALGITPGAQLKLSAQGEDEDAAITALGEYIVKAM